MSDATDNRFYREKEQPTPEVRVLHCVWCNTPVEALTPEVEWAICERCVKPDNGELFEAIYGRK